MYRVCKSGGQVIIITPHSSCQEAFFPDHLSYWNEAWCKSYKYHCLQKIPLAYFKPPVKPKGAKIIIFHGEINPPDAVNGGGGKWYRYVLPSDWIKEAWQ